MNMDEPHEKMLDRGNRETKITQETSEKEIITFKSRSMPTIMAGKKMRCNTCPS